ncbi:MAG TPA: hypothetical protein VKI65_08905 [Gemmataceae bacterium]|nr:hypothetical protein [Gemmataceae bacterium]
MILNAYALLDAFVTLLRSFLALLVIGQAALALVHVGPGASPDRKKLVEDRYYLLFLLAILLLGLNVVSWPLFYLLLQSYVSEWPVMCIYGVTQVGTGSISSSRFLPGLVKTLEATKPALVFLSGAWFVLYFINRQTQTGPLMRRVLIVLIVLGGLALADSAVEMTYLVIPKKEEFLSVGCCTVPFDAETRASRFVPEALLGERYHTGLYIAFYSLTGGLTLALGLFSRRVGGVGLGALAAVALMSLVVGGVFLIETAAPRLLRLASHHCPYCLLPKAPESTVAIGLFLLGTFAVGWAGTARWFASCAETNTLVANTVRGALRLAFFAYFGSIVMISLELALAGAWGNRVG